jgi:serine/threonine-protein kinase
MSEEIVNKRLAKGDRLGKYEVLEFVASGGMGTVYKARDADLDRVVALKVLPRSLANQPKMLDRFRREARSAARLHHENIVAIHGFGDQDGLFYLALEYIPGIDLQEYVEKRHHLPPEEARQIILQATRALAHSHEQQVVHRDVKPSNFLLTRKDGKLIVKLIDLGLAIHPSDEEFRLTREGTTVGTVDYMAPEQARDSSSADVRSDIYSLGCTFYHILTGTAPFAQGTMAERLLQHLQEVPADVRTLNKDVPAGYVAILQRMLAKKPEERYQTPQELLRDLEDPSRVILRAEKALLPEGIETRALPEAKKAPGRPRDETLAVAVATAPTEPEPELPADDEPAVPESAAPPAPPAPRPPRRERKAPRPRRERPPKAENLPLRDPPVESDLPLRDPVEKPGDKKSGAIAVPPLLILGSGAVVLVGVVIVAVLLSAGTGPTKLPEPPPAPPTNPGPAVALPDPNAGKHDLDKPSVAGNADQMLVARPALPALYQPSLPLDAAVLRREFYGAFDELPRPPASVAELRVSRDATPGPGSYRTLADALANLPAGAAIIEIHDRGPLFISNLPVLTGGDVVLRGAPGYRPLIAWEPAMAATGKTLPVLLAQERGQLKVEGVDIVVKWTDPQPTGPACLFQLADGELQLRDCTVSLAGKHPHGIIVARAQRPSLAGATGSARLRISRCYARGTDLTALAIDATSADVLIDQTLLAGNVQPLLRVTCRDEDEVKLRVVRSTLVAAQTLLRVEDAAGQRGSPHVQALVWDAILARNDPAAAAGDLVQLAGMASADRMGWRVVNSVYAGWKKLLSGSTQSIGGGELDAWHTQWQYREGDRALLETWPNNPPAQLEDLPAPAFYAYDEQVGFAANAGAGPLGALVGRLPAEPADWLKRTWDRPPLTLAAVPDPGVPPIDAATDGLYHGERVELPPRADVGLVLNKLLHAKPLAKRVVFHIAGSGDHPSSTLRVQGVAELALYFEPPLTGSKYEPLVLTVDPKGVSERSAALVEVDRGSLELIGAHVRCENSKFAVVPPHLVKVVGGQLVLHRCHLQGPLGRSSEGFRSLIAVSGPARGPLECRLSDSILLSGKGIITTTGAAVRLAARQNVAVALGDAIVADFTGVSEPEPTKCDLDGNTWALRRALIGVRAGPDLPDRAGLVQVQALANWFTDPFGDAPGHSTLLRLPETFLGRGQLLWQGKGNAFDRRMAGYFAVAGRDPAGKQVLADWVRAWGRATEPDALLVEPGAAAKGLSPDTPQLDRLALPATARPEPGNPVPGADLARLGLLKKKG